MNTSKIENRQAGTAADSSTKDDVTTSSQTIGKPLVGGSLSVYDFVNIPKNVEKPPVKLFTDLDSLLNYAFNYKDDFDYIEFGWVKPASTKLGTIHSNSLLHRSHCKYLTDELVYKRGFEFEMQSENDCVFKYCKLTFRGFYRWVYFYNNKPIYYTNIYCQIDSPPHLDTYYKDIFSKIEFDRYERCRF